VRQHHLLYVINILGVKGVMKTNMHRNALHVANLFWMKFSMPWERLGTLQDVSSARNVDQISEMMDSLLTQLITSQCAKLVNM